MRRALWIIAGVAGLAALWVLVPSLIVQQRVAGAARAQWPEMESLSVRAWTDAPGFLQGRVRRLDVTATRVRLGDLTAERLKVTLRAVAFRLGDEPAIIGLRSGTAGLSIGRRDLEDYLSGRGIADPAVTIDPSGVSATGGVRVGPVLATARLHGQFYLVGGTELHFQVASLDVAGVEVAPALATSLLGVAGRPILSLRGLPVPVVMEQIRYGPDAVVILARAGDVAP